MTFELSIKGYMGGSKGGRGEARAFQIGKQSMQMSCQETDQGQVSAGGAQRRSVCVGWVVEFHWQGQGHGVGVPQTPQVSDNSLSPVAQPWSLPLPLELLLTSPIRAAPSQRPLGCGSVCSQAGSGQEREVAGNHSPRRSTQQACSFVWGHLWGPRFQESPGSRSRVGLKSEDPASAVMDEEKSQELLAC